MPHQAVEIQSAIATLYDVRRFSGVDLFSRDTSTYSMPTFSTVGEGLYDDILVFLNGRGCQSGETFAGVARDFWPTTPPATLDFLIGDDDKLVIRSNANFRVKAGPYNYLFGIDPSGQTATFAGGFFNVFAQNDWIRGNIPPNTYLEFFSFTSFTSANCYFPMYQDIPTGCVETSVSDTLEEIDTADLHWGVNEFGQVWWCSTFPIASPFAWLDLDFMRLLGFTGEEAVSTTTYGGSYSIGINPCRFLTLPSRPFPLNLASVEQEATGMRTIGDGWVGQNRGTYQMRFFEFWIDGPADACITASKRVYDLHQHWLRYMMPMLTAGMPMVVYQDWGDSRVSGFDVDGDEYSNTVTVERNGYRGRLEGYMASPSDATKITWPKALRRRAPLSFMMQVGDSGGVG